MKKFLLYLLHSAYLALTAAPVVLYAAASAGAPAWPAMLLLCGASFAGNAVSCFLRERRALFALLAAGLAAAGAALLPLFPWSLLLAAMNLVVALTGARRRWNEPETELVDARVMVAGLIVCAVVYLMGLFNGLPAVQARVGVLAADQPPVRAHKRRRPGAADDARKPGPDLGLPRGADARCVL